MSWQQNLANAHMELGRCLFESNRPGFTKDDVCYKEKPDIKYIEAHMKEALSDLTKAIEEISEITTNLKLKF